VGYSREQPAFGTSKWAAADYEPPAPSGSVELFARDVMFTVVADKFEEVFWLISADWRRPLYMSPAYERVFGYKIGELTPAAWLEAIDPEDRPNVQAYLEERAAQTSFAASSSPPHRFRRADGKVRNVRFRAYPVTDEAGVVVAFAGITSDETDRILTEESLQRSRAELQNVAASIERAQEDERRRTAQFVHDELGQSLALAKLKLEAFLAEKRIARDDKDVIKLLVAFQNAIDASRRVAYEMSPPVLHELGLIAALEAEGELLCAEYGVDFSVVAGIDPLPEFKDNVLVYRSVRELIMNVIKHASAKHLKLTIEGSHKLLTINLTDDGLGFDEATHKAKYGLASVRQRLSYLGGELHLSSQLGVGTSAEIRIPLGEFA